MDRRRFFVWSAVGAVLWVVSITLLGYFLGEAFPALGENIDYAILAILAFSVIPIAYEWSKHRRASHASAPDARRRHAVGRGQPPPSRLSRLAASRAASSSALVSTGRTSSPTSASGFSPAGLRSIAHTTTSTDRAGLAQRVGRVADGAAGRDHVLDQRDPPPGDVRALGELAGAVLLGLLAHEQRRQPGRAAHHGRDRDAAQLEPAEQLGVRRAPARPSRRPPGPAAPGRPRRGTCRSTRATPGRTGA